MSSGGQSLRIVVLSHGGPWEAWEAESLRKISELKFATIILFVEDASTNDATPTFLQRIKYYKWNRLFWNRWFKKYGRIAATSPTSLPEALQAIPIVKVKAERKGKYSEYFSAKDVDMVRTYQPDVIIRFGFNILRGEILTAAKHGVWSFHHADHHTIRGGPAGFWEYILGYHTTGAILQQLTEKLDEGIVLRQGQFELIKHSFSENLHNLLFNSTGWIANALSELHYNGRITNQSESKLTQQAPLYRYPGNLRMLQFWMILLANKCAFHWNNLFKAETWMIGIVDQPYSEVLVSGITKMPKWTRAKNSLHYVADPFSYSTGGKLIILAEEYSYETGVGHIINLATGEAVLSKPFHLSFPNVIEIEGENYVLAESSANGSLQAFSILSSGKDHELIKEPIVDPILLQHDNLYWIFGHKLDDQNNAALFVYYASNAVGPYTPHALNPVKTDISNSRSAGPIILHQGKLLRPAQDSGNGYGSAVVINEIQILSTTQYKEIPVSRIAPDKNWEYNRGLHTVSPLGTTQTLIDAKSYRFNFANFKAEMKRKLRRILK